MFSRRSNGGRSRKKINSCNPIGLVLPMSHALSSKSFPNRRSLCEAKGFQATRNSSGVLRVGSEHKALHSSEPLESKPGAPCSFHVWEAPSCSAGGQKSNGVWCKGPLCIPSPLLRSCWLGGTAPINPQFVSFSWCRRAGTEGMMTAAIRCWVQFSPPALLLLGKGMLGPCMQPTSALGTLQGSGCFLLHFMGWHLAHTGMLVLIPVCCQLTGLPFLCQQEGIRPSCY